MLNELKSLLPTVLQSALQGVYNSLLDTRPADLFSTELNSYSVDGLLTKCRTFLVNVIDDAATTSVIRELCVKIILLIGNVRASAEDLLYVSNLVKKHNMSVNFDQELSRFSFENRSNELTERTWALDKTFMTPVAGDIDFSLDNWCAAFDCHQIYVHTKGKGLVTIAKTDGLPKDIGHVLL
jgi:hypothetical protein